VASFGALSLHPKIPFPETLVEREVQARLKQYSGFLHCRNSGPWTGAPTLFRIESERLKLPAPFGRRIAEPLDADAVRQATFYGCLDKIGGEEGEREGHIDLSYAAFLPGAELCDRSHPT
jgi:hypothetical protein